MKPGIVLVHERIVRIMLGRPRRKIPSEFAHQSNPVGVHCFLELIFLFGGYPFREELGTPPEYIPGDINTREMDGFLIAANRGH